MLYSFVNLFPKESAYKIFRRNSRIYNKKNTKRLRCQGWGSVEETQGFIREWFTETDEIEFEGMKFRCPKDYDGFLVHSFGDYMTLPPVEERKPRHTAVYIKFPEE